MSVVNSSFALGGTTFTLKEQLAVWPAASCAVLTTVVVPKGKTLPEAGGLLALTPGQLSVAVAEASRELQEKTRAKWKDLL